MPPRDHHLDFSYSALNSAPRSSLYSLYMPGLYPGISIRDVARKLGEMWNNLSDREKQPYINQAAKLEEKYEKDVAD